MQTRRARRLVLAAVLGGAAFGSVYAFAATLGVSSQSLGAGSQTVAACTASVSASYTIAYSASLPGYRVSGVNVNGLSPCQGKSITVDLTGSANASLGEVTYGPVTATDATAGNVTIAVPASPGVSAAAVTGVSVAIGG